MDAANYSAYSGYAHLGAGLTVGMSSLAAGLAIGIVGDAGVRANAQQPRLFVGPDGWMAQSHSSWSRMVRIQTKESLLAKCVHVRVAEVSKVRSHKVKVSFLICARDDPDPHLRRSFGSLRAHCRTSCSIHGRRQRQRPLHTLCVTWQLPLVLAH